MNTNISICAFKIFLISQYVYKTDIYKHQKQKDGGKHELFEIEGFVDKQYVKV